MPWTMLRDPALLLTGSSGPHHCLLHEKPTKLCISKKNMHGATWDLYLQICVLNASRWWTFKNLETFLKHFTDMDAPGSLAEVQGGQIPSAQHLWTNKDLCRLGAGSKCEVGVVVPQPHCLNMHQNSNADGSHKSRCRQKQVSNAVHSNKSSKEQQGKAGVHEWGHDNEILVVIALQVSSQEIKGWRRGRPHLFCLNLTAKKFCHIYLVMSERQADSTETAETARGLADK